MKQVRNYPILLIIIGVAAFAFAAYSYVSQKVFVENNFEATGIIVDIKEKQTKYRSYSTGKDNIKAYKPVVMFETKYGEKIKFTAVSGSIDRSKYQINDEIAVLYNPNNPQKALVKKEKIQSTACISGGAGLLFLLIGFVIMILNKRKM